MKKTCFTFALKYEETFSPTEYIITHYYIYYYTLFAMVYCLQFGFKENNNNYNIMYQILCI